MTFNHHHRLDGCQWCEGRQNLWGAFVLGIGIFAFGMILILDNFGVIDGSVLALWWPLLLIVVGVSHLVESPSVRKIGWGLSWIAVGAIILLENLGLIAVGIEVLWPVVIVILGTNLVISGVRRWNRGVDHDSDPDSAPLV